MTFNVGVIIGPILGGIMADPAGSYPNVFGNVEFFKRYPYALPNIVSAIFLSMAALGVFFGLAEVSLDFDWVLQWLSCCRHLNQFGIKRIWV